MSGKRWRTFLKAVLIALFVLMLATGGGVLFLCHAMKDHWGADPAGRRLQRMEACPTYRHGCFVNTLPTEIMQSGRLLETLRLSLAHRNSMPARPLPVIFQTAAAFAHPPKSGLRITWLGHATFLIELDGKTILTDPVFSDRASPLSWIGPKRFHPVPIAIPALPSLDAVVISHDHYDHLDDASIRQLLPKTGKFIVPLGVGAHLEAWGVPAGKIVELYWWEETALDNIRLVATPARHYSGRGLKQNNTLWASWAMIGPRHRIFYSGDSGRMPEFEMIGRRFGPFDFALIKIGAYGQTWPDIHATPEEASEINKLVIGRVMIPCHWGTFDLAFHDWDEPIRRLLLAAQKDGVRVVVPKPGEMVMPDALPPLTRWWEENQKVENKK
jgi:L-ascorbate metabolism protein UlaG (beta-lactamase superfamily)